MLILLLGMHLPACNSLFSHQPQNSNANPSKSLLSIEITTQLGDRQTFFQGDEIQFLVSLNKSAYVTAIYQDARGELWQVYPNQFSTRGMLAAGEYLSLPQANESFRYIASAPFGSETLYAFASSKPMAELSYKKTINGLHHLTLDIDQINRQLEGHSQQQNAALASAKLSINTQARP